MMNIKKRRRGGNEEKERTTITETMTDDDYGRRFKFFLLSSVIVVRHRFLKGMELFIPSSVIVHRKGGQETRGNNVKATVRDSKKKMKGNEEKERTTIT